MKKIQFAVIAIFCIIAFTSCRHFNRKATTIHIDDNRGSIEIKCAGDIAFNNNADGIESMSPHAYLKYKKNGRKIMAESNFYGDIRYRMDNGSTKSDLNSNDKEFLAVAIKEIIQSRNK